MKSTGDFGIGASGFKGFRGLGEYSGKGGLGTNAVRVCKVTDLRAFGLASSER